MSPSGIGVPNIRRAHVAAPVTDFQYMQAPVGWDSDTPPQFMPEQFAPVLDNFIPRNGKLTLRQPFSTQKTANSNGDWASSGILNIRGYAIYSELLLFGTPTVFATSAPQYSNDEGLWAPEAGYTGTVTYGAANSAPSGLFFLQADWLAAPGVSSTLGTGIYPPGKSYTTLHNNAYSVSLPTSSAGLSGACGDSALMTWTRGIPAAAVNISSVTGCPRSSTSVCKYQGRVWVLGGFFTGDASSTYSSNMLIFSNPLLPADVPSTSSYWHDAISGAENNLLVDPDTSDPALGLAAFNQRLIIFRYNSVYVMLGTTPANYSVQLLSNTVGCADQQSIVETGQGVYFLSPEGLQLTTGTSVTNVSGNVQESLSAAVQRYRRSVGLGGTGDCTAAKLLNGDILLTIRVCDTGSIANTVGFNTIWSGVYSPTTGTWYRVSSVLFANGDSNQSSLGGVDALPAYVVSGNGGVLSVGNKRGVAIEAPGKPAMASTDVLPKLGGLSVYPLISGMDIQPLTTSTANVYPIPARWLSSFIPLAPSGRFHSSLVRYFADYLLQQDTDPSSSTPLPPFTVSLVTVSGETLATLSLPPAENASGDFPGPYGTNISSIGMSLSRQPMVQRVNSDAKCEMEHAMFLVQAPSSAWAITEPVLITAEVLGIGIEFQQGRNLEELSP